MVKRIIHHLKNLFTRLFGKKRVIRLGIYGEPNTGKTTLANKISLDWLGKPVGIVSEMPHTTRTIQRVEHIEIKAGSKKLIMNLLDMPGLATKIDYKKFLKYKKPTPVDPVDVYKFKNFTVAKLKKIAKHKGIKVKSSVKKSTLVKKLKETITESELKEIAKELNIKPKASKPKKFTKEEAKKLAEEATKGVIEAIRWLDNVDAVIVMMDSTKDPLTQVNIMLLGNLEAKGIPVVIAANKMDLENSNPAAIRSAFPQHPVVPISAKKGDNLEELYKTIAENT